MDDMKDKGSDKPKPGPSPDRLKIDGDWQEALGRAVRHGDKKKPPPGEPDDGVNGDDADDAMDADT